QMQLATLTVDGSVSAALKDVRGTLQASLAVPSTTAGPLLELVQRWLPAALKPHLPADATFAANATVSTGTGALVEATLRHADVNLQLATTVSPSGNLS